MKRVLQSCPCVFLVLACVAAHAHAQTPQLVFTAPAPDAASSEIHSTTSAVVEDRALAMWAGNAADFGIGVTTSTSRWTVRSITSMTSLPVESRSRPTFQQIEITRPLFSTNGVAVAAGGGIREEWDGTRTLIGRVLAGSEVAGGWLQGSVVMERAISSLVRHDAADVVTSVGWARRVSDRISVGVEGIGQDLEGLWDPAEADGGARLLVGPSLHAESRSGNWAANFTAGPVMHGTTLALPINVSTSTNLSAGRHLGIFASATWQPSFRR